MSNVSFVVVNVTTQAVVRGGTCAGESVAAQAMSGEVAYPVEPGVLGWPDVNLTPQKHAVWLAAKAKRDAIINSGAMTPSGLVDSDEISRSNIAGATMAAMLAQQAGQSFSIEWTLATNDVVTLDAEQMIGVGLATMSHVNSAHDRARALRTEIESATDLVALLTMDLETGWPA
ncbi:DUF4376 domain-containing protein [Sphingobium sp. H39-3-25]|uniref:DUF4376 domain-containing protein n=1 Tax=Sphingobium arseniciresistens TaxID=3030834 RepID=UPI0023B980C7|nr:DUF4376 domain-containing protein [Sphingobium arseniciresistens]